MDNDSLVEYAWNHPVVHWEVYSLEDAKNRREPEDYVRNICRGAPDNEPGALLKMLNRAWCGLVQEIRLTVPKPTETTTLEEFLASLEGQKHTWYQEHTWLWCQMRYGGLLESRGAYINQSPWHKSFVEKQERIEHQEPLRLNLRDYLNGEYKVGGGIRNVKGGKEGVASRSAALFLLNPRAMRVLDLYCIEK